MHEVLVNRLGVLSLPRKSVVRLTDRPDMTLDVYRGRKTKQINNNNNRLKYQTSAVSWHLPSRNIPQGRTQNTRMQGGGGGGASVPDPEQSNTGYDVSGGSRKGGESGV